MYFYGYRQHQPHAFVNKLYKLYILNSIYFCNVSNKNRQLIISGSSTFALLLQCFCLALALYSELKLPYCSTALLLYCPTALLPYCFTALLLYCPTALLPYCSTALLLYCPTALLTFLALHPEPHKLFFIL